MVTSTIIWTPKWTLKWIPKWTPKQWKDTLNYEDGGQKTPKVDKKHKKGGQKIRNDTQNDTQKVKNDTQG